MKRRLYIIQGQVQGVGFRPFVYTKATELGLTGLVYNMANNVRIEVQGKEDILALFAKSLQEELPPLARIDKCIEEDLPVQFDEKKFVIQDSQTENDEKQVQGLAIPADVAPCKACLQELYDKKDRRFHYPFINCTDCGPRITITHKSPYDRKHTSMACFDLCEYCAKEYHDPKSRRFHAQPLACPVCGPHIWLCEPFEEDSHKKKQLPTMKVLHIVCKALEEGKIVAIKGLGGFHLACDATNEEAIVRLRERKRRPHKALAVMVENLEEARSYAHISEEEAQNLESQVRPIALLKQKAQTLPKTVNPDIVFSTCEAKKLCKEECQQGEASQGRIGLMLPSSPLHELLLRLYKKPLIMTSGNSSGEAICLGNREAISALSDIADLFVLHNRDILIRQDDSVVLFVQKTQNRKKPKSELLTLRRSRGLMPSFVKLPHKGPPILACGALLKNTLTCTQGDKAYVSQHIGDLDNLKNFAFFEEMAEHLVRFVHSSPKNIECIAADLHPDYPSSRWAKDFAKNLGIPFVPVQHHVAHAYAVLAEHGHTGPALALCLDGMGLGFDKKAWGGELLFVHPAALRQQNTKHAPLNTKIGQLQAIPLLAGDKDVQEPWRLALSLLSVLPQTLGASYKDIEQRQPWPWEESKSAISSHISDLAQRGYGELTTSCGRLFDAVSALLGLCETISYEGQAAIRLEHKSYQFGNFNTILQIQDCIPEIAEKNSLLELETHRLFYALARAYQEGKDTAFLSAFFHTNLAKGLAALAHKKAKDLEVKHLAISGGVAQNSLLLRLVLHFLQDSQLHILLPRAYPPNDGGISLGQAFYCSYFL